MAYEVIEQIPAYTLLSILSKLLNSGINVLLSITLVDECVLLMSVCWSHVSVPGRLLSILLSRNSSWPRYSIGDYRELRETGYREQMRLKS